MLSITTERQIAQEWQRKADHMHPSEATTEVAATNAVLSATGGVSSMPKQSIWAAGTAADPNLFTVSYEYTDTFGGEANYSWVKRGEYQESHKTPDALIVKAVKARVGLTGVRCKRAHHGDMIELRPYGSATVLFINLN
jgi:hypothetical protein